MNKALAAFAAIIVFLVSRHVLSVGFISSVIVTGLAYTGVSAVEGHWPHRIRQWIDRRGSRRSDRLGSRTGSRLGERKPLEPEPKKSYLDTVPDLAKLGISREEFDEALTTGSRKLVQLRKATAKVADSTVRGKAHSVCDAAARILSEIRQDPADLRKARNFLDYYMDATINVVERYVSLSGRGVRTPEMTAALQRAEESLETIRSAYDKQLAQMLENDVMDLDVELRVLERTIEMEGLGDN